jgi:UTP--glucose-1-phosphate uridylyltransferase
MITKAIIPVAGYGTRRLPVAKSIEKCMLPIGNRPIVDYVVRDCVAAGITDIYFIVSSENSQLKSYYSQNDQLNEYLIANNKRDLLPLVEVPPVNFHYIVQPSGGKYGTAVPISLAFPELVEGESVVVLMGDDFIYNKDSSSETARLIGAVPGGGSAMLGVHVPIEQVSRYGVLELDEHHNFVKIVEKPSIDEAPSDLINVSKYVLDYDLLKLITEYVKEDVSGEYYITEPINNYVAMGGTLKVIPATGQYLDGGNLEGWLRANNIVVGDLIL